MSDASFVAGATGLTGRAIVAHLARERASVIAHVRPDSPQLSTHRAQLAGIGAEVDVTPWEEGAISATLARIRPAFVYACLGTTRARARAAARAGRDPAAESYDAIDVALTETTIRASAASGVRRFVYLSSIGAGEGARGAYLLARTRVERTLIASGVSYTIVRPSFIVGEREAARASEARFGAIADAGLAMIGALGARRTRERYRSIRGDDLARAMIALARDPAWENRIAEGEDLHRLG
jgi:uncharacterized protein YbjT (DUF2867 family)